jgi:hypothetical protein
MVVVLAAVGVILLIGRQAGETHGDERDARKAARDADDEIDYETLEQAEREVRDLDADATPEDGFAGDDWGPGTRKPPVA